MNTQVIGYVGENGTRDVQIPVGHLLEKWPDLSPSILMVPVGGADDDAYPVDSELVGSDLVWHVSAADTAAIGTTKATVRMTAADGRVALDEPFTVIVSQNVSAGGTPPSPIRFWVDMLAELTPRAEKAADDAAKAANRANDAAQNWEDGTAANAALLANKPPEYYLTPVNLLDNSFFVHANGVVNTKGRLIYEAPSGAPDVFDRWYANRATVKVEDDGIRLVRNTSASQSSTYIGQKIKHPENLLGRVLTLAFATSVGMVVGSFTFTGENVVAAVHGGWSATYSKSATSFVLQTAAEAEIKIQWAALYEGAYTEDTLPPYVPKGYANELVACSIAETGRVYDSDRLGGKEAKEYATTSQLTQALKPYANKFYLYLDGVGGNDANDGKTEQTPVKTFARALEAHAENALDMRVKILTGGVYNVPFNTASSVSWHVLSEVEGVVLRFDGGKDFVTLYGEHYNFQGITLQSDKELRFEGATMGMANVVFDVQALKMHDCYIDTTAPITVPEVTFYACRGRIKALTSTAKTEHAVIVHRGCNLRLYNTLTFAAQDEGTANTAIYVMDSILYMDINGANGSGFATAIKADSAVVLLSKERYNMLKNIAATPLLTDDSLPSLIVNGTYHTGGAYDT